MSMSKLLISKEIRITMTYKKQFETVKKGLLVWAPAKINLSLLVGGKRPDGFHEIETVIAKVNFYDEIFIQKGQKTGIELVCKGAHWAPQGEENLVYKAAKMLLESYGQKADTKITLTKNIPAGSGLGSASSDAAATLMGINKFLKLDLGPRKLNKTAAGLGTDVPFFLDGPLAFCTGKGEKIKKLDEKFNFLALIILPDVSVPTKKVYANFKANKDLYEKLSAEINSHIKKNRIDLVAKMCANLLQIRCFSLYKELAELKDKAESLIQGHLCLTGSGSAMFCIVENRSVETAKKIKRKLKTVGCKSVIVSNNRW
jgi:4-diphosphocytidyl-2-C-methyl-D-erythritol kinase